MKSCMLVSRAEREDSRMVGGLLWGSSSVSGGGGNAIVVPPIVEYCLVYKLEVSLKTFQNKIQQSNFIHKF